MKIPLGGKPRGRGNLHDETYYMKQAKNGTGFPLLLQSYAEGMKAIPYRKELNLITGRVTATLLLQQIIFRASTCSNPFYKFQAPCRHELYLEGDSWQEELGFSRTEFETAIKSIGTRINKGDKKSEIAKKEVSESMVLYWTDRNRVTWWELNVPLVTKMIEKCLTRLSNAENLHQIRKEENLHQQLMQESRIRSNSEITTETTTENTLLSEARESGFGNSDPSIPEPKQKSSSVNATPGVSPPRGKGSAAAPILYQAPNNSGYQPVDVNKWLQAWNKADRPAKWPSMSIGMMSSQRSLDCLRQFIAHEDGDEDAAIATMVNRLSNAKKDPYWGSKPISAYVLTDPNKLFLAQFDSAPVVDAEEEEDFVSRMYRLYGDQNAES